MRRDMSRLYGGVAEIVNNGFECSTMQGEVLWITIVGLQLGADKQV
jgi:hypothetical protein